MITADVDTTNVAEITAGKSKLGLEVIGDQIIVLEDKFKTGYECSKCDGEGYTNEDCDFCKGTGKETDFTMCRICCARNLVESGKYNPGKKICEQCAGKGSLIVAPQSAEMKPTTGTIVSKGPDVYEDTRIINNITGQRWAYPLKIGDRVLYSQFAGVGVNLKQKQIIRIMHAHEVMCKIYGTAKFGDFTK